MCDSLNSYVATSTILLRQSFYAASSNWCRDPIFMSRQHFCFGSCYNIVSCIVRTSIATQKFCRDRFLSPFNLISCCSFILMLRHGHLVLSMFAVATQFVMSRQDFSVFNLSLYRDPVCYVVTRLLFLVLESLSRHRKVCRDLVYLCSANRCVATLGSLSRHRLISSA